MHLLLADPSIPIEQNLPEYAERHSAIARLGRRGGDRRVVPALPISTRRIASTVNLRREGPGAEHYLGASGGTQVMFWAGSFTSQVLQWTQFCALIWKR